MIILITVNKYIVNPGEIERWIVVGKTKDYLVSDDFCSCKDFMLHIGKACKHIAEMKKARSSGNHERFNLTFEEFEPLRKEFLDL